MRKRPDAVAPRRARQSGYSLIEVMFASVVLSLMVLSVSSYWFTAMGRAADLVLRQKAIFVLNAEVERISALYVYTNFGSGGGNGPLSTTGYDGLAAIPTTRDIYPNSVTAAYANSDFITTTLATFQGSDFYVWRVAGTPSTNSRDYVWIDRSRNIAGRISWVTTDINAVCSDPDCSCQKFDNTTGNGQHCQRLDVYLEYPYAFSSTGTVTPPATLKTISIRTIVGRGDA